jgi:hypothetical protein
LKVEGRNWSSEQSLGTMMLILPIENIIFIMLRCWNCSSCYYSLHFIMLTKINNHKFKICRVSFVLVLLSEKLWRIVAPILVGKTFTTAALFPILGPKQHDCAFVVDSEEKKPQCQTVSVLSLLIKVVRLICLIWYFFTIHM